MRLSARILGAVYFIAAFASLSIASEARTLQSGLVGGTWQWTGTQTPGGNDAVPKPANYTVEFVNDKTVNIKADCNTGGGPYTASGSSLSFGAIGMTRMYCQPPTLDRKFMQSLAAVRSYKIQGNALYMSLAADGGTMRFSKARENPLVGTKWNWQGTRTPAADITSPDPSKYWLHFKPAGVVEIQADCNKIGGSYTVDGSNITIKGGPSTLMACPPGSMDKTFMQGVGSMSTFKIIAKVMISELSADSGTMAFTKAELGSPNTLVGKKWSWTNTQTPVENFTVPIPANYTLEFKADGTVLIKADCNNGNGTYQTDGSSITFGPTFAMTSMMCKPGSLDSKFLRSLAMVRTYSVTGHRLSMDMQADSGTMMFVNSTN